MKGFRERALQILFPLTLAWAGFWLFAQEIESVFGLIPVSEEHWLHDALEAMVAPLIFAAFVAVAVYCFYRWPWFLKVPESISLVWLTSRLLVYAPLLFALLMGVIFSAWWYLVGSKVEPGHSQYGLDVLFIAYFFSITLTPLFTVVIVWWSALRKHRRTTG